MAIHLDRRSSVPLVRQLYQEMADRIRSGLLEEGAPLPSIRQLSQQARVSFMTVVQAYELLEQEGLITRVHGRGTYVGRKERHDAVEERPVSGLDWQLAITDYLPRAQFWRQLQYARPDTAISLATTTLSPELVLQLDWTKTIQQIVGDDPSVLFAYSPVQGDPALREAAAAYLRAFGLQLVPEELLVMNGAQQGIDQVARCFVGPGDIVVTEAPTYSAAIDVFRGRGATIRTIPVDEEGMRVDLLAPLLDREPPKLIYTVPTYQNPTGVVMSARRRAQLLDLAESCHCLILEDDPWGELTYSGEIPPTIKSMDRHGHVIYLKGFSKMLAPGCRVAVLAASGTVLTRLTAAKTLADLGSPLLTQRVVAALLSSPKMSKYLKQLQVKLHRRRNLVLTLLEQHAPQGISWTVPQGGSNIWITLPTWLSADELIFPAGQRQIDFMPGSICYPGEPEAHHLRISFSFAEEKKLAEGIVELCKLFSAEIEQQSHTGKLPTI
ncbi:PLP-dependent aminotransferase family protein [Brevibacillus humidisoli]|uniref:MocR-like pyridoxine biosynthesis transcription factor PdxR n=1 Tax=Brevibacillus humidisoli TaxID=2895522 RepID=UPI001E4F3365|nr:PLP-dependent aminotransferase family protein [Brevibacillus humidisoli]UFJ39846.1 PLP-dependent aminotransferase family protein [Brevibacillus humidisoli]